MLDVLCGWVTHLVDGWPECGITHGSGVVQSQLIGHLLRRRGSAVHLHRPLVPERQPRLVVVSAGVRGRRTAQPGQQQHVQHPLTHPRRLANTARRRTRRADARIGGRSRSGRQAVSQARRALS